MFYGKDFNEKEKREDRFDTTQGTRHNVIWNRYREENLEGIVQKYSKRLRYVRKM